MTPGPRSQGRILITEDEFGLRRTLHTTLQTLGFEIAEASSGEQALQTIKGQKFDVVLLDINMPGMGGIEACRRLRQMAPGLQILMLTVRDSEEDKVLAIDSGADDYITKPFSLPELAARIRSAVRRSMASQPSESATISIGDIELDPERRIVRKGRQAVSLSPKEFDLLNYLMKHAGLPVTHARLLKAVWGEEYGQELEYLRTFVYHLRKKLEDDPTHPHYLLTEPYLGYRFCEPEERGSIKEP
jgi:two-component system, OmpR family, KDP operon response regulator KdpE